MQNVLRTDEAPDEEAAHVMRRREDGKPEGVPAELADIVIRVFDMAKAYGIDLADAIEEKMAYNMTRPHKHGRTM